MTVLRQAPRTSLVSHSSLQRLPNLSRIHLIHPMARKNYYAVRKGHEPGIYTNWYLFLFWYIFFSNHIHCRKTAKAQVNHYPHNEYKGFADLQSACQYLANGSGQCGQGH